MLFIKILQMCNVTKVEIAYGQTNRGLKAFLAISEHSLTMFLFLSLCGCKGVGSGPTWHSMHCAKASMNPRPSCAEKGLIVCRAEPLECTPVPFWSGVSGHRFAGSCKEWQNKDRKQAFLSVLLRPCNSPPLLCSDYKQESHTFRILQPSFLNWMLLFRKCNPPFLAAWT